MAGYIGTSLPGDVGGAGVRGSGAVNIAASPNPTSFIQIGGVTAWFSGPNGGSGTLTVKVGGIQRWSAPVNGGMHMQFPGGIQASPGQSVQIECSGADLAVYGAYLTPIP